MIEVEHLCKRYGTVAAVSELSFQVAAGDVVGFLGPNGAGKSTTLRIVAGFLGATSGSVRIAGHDIRRHRLQALSKLGYMPETSPLYPEMRVGEYLRFRAELKDVRRTTRRAEVERVTELAGVRHMLQVGIAHLSKGYRQRVGLADALLGSPPLIILDEPSAGLDPNQIREVRNLVRALAHEHTILLSTHILTEVEASCDRAIVINEGKLVAAGPIDSLQQQHGDARVKLILRAPDSGALQLLENHQLVASAQARALTAGLLEVVVTLTRGKSDGDSIEQLVFALAAAQVGIRQITPLAASLEHVFSKLTRGDSNSDDDHDGDGGDE